MFKSTFKRSWLSTVRKPSRTIILLLILFVMANLMLAMIAIKNSVNSSVEYAKEKISGVVYLSVDTAKLRAQIQSQNNSSGSTSGFTIPTITESLAKGIAQSNYIKDYTYSVGVSANASGFTAVQTAQNQRERQYQDALNNARTQVNNATNQYNAARDSYNAANQSQNSGESGGTRTVRSGTRPNFNFNMNINISDPTLGRGDMTVQGVNAWNFVDGVETGTVSLVSGKAFNETTGKGVMISKELADANSLKVGGELKLKTVATDPVEVTFTIVGIYQATDQNFDNNTIYTNIDSAKSLMTADMIKNLTVNNVRYYLTSASDKDAFLKWANSKYPDLAKQNLTLNIDDSSYQTMVGPIENVGSFATTVMWIVMIAAVIIITLIVVINVKDRRYEMGVLLGLGAHRRGIVGQVFLELIIVGTVGFLLSLGTSQFLAKKMGDELLKQQVAASQQAANTNNQNSQSGRGQFMIGGGPSRTSNVKAIDTINVSAGLNEYLILFGAGYAILLLAMIVPSINILRYQPKTILTGKE